MSLKTIITAVCDEVGLPAPAAIAANPNSQLARQMFALANLELRELSKARDWPALNVSYFFNTVPGQQAYNLPADFNRPMPGTVYDAAQYTALRGSVPPEEWAARQNGLLANLIGFGYRIIGGVLKLTPTPTSVDQVVLEYQTSMYALSGGINVPQYQLDDDVSKVDETLVQMGLKWRIKHAKGLDYSEDRAAFDRAEPRRFAQAMSPPTYTVGRNNLMSESPLTEGFVRDGAFGA